MSTYVEEVRALAEVCVRNMEREELHNCSMHVISLPDCDGMTDEFLFAQHKDAVAEYLQDLSKEV